MNKISLQFTHHVVKTYEDENGSYNLSVLRFIDSESESQPAHAHTVRALTPQARAHVERILYPRRAGGNGSEVGK